MTTLEDLRSKYNSNYGNDGEVEGPEYQYFCYLYSMKLDCLEVDDFDDDTISSIIWETKNQSGDGRFIVQFSVSENSDDRDFIKKVINTVKNYKFEEGESCTITTVNRFRNGNKEYPYNCYLIQISNSIGERHVVC